MAGTLGQLLEIYNCWKTEDKSYNIHTCGMFQCLHDYNKILCRSYFIIQSAIRFIIML